MMQEEEEVVVVVVGVVRTYVGHRSEVVPRLVVK